MHPIQQWILRYISSQLSVGQDQAHRVWKEINEWVENDYSTTDLYCYEPKILLPVAHILVLGWPGSGCIIGFDELAYYYGIPSLEPIKRLMDGLDPEYERLRRKEYAESVVTDERCLALRLSLDAARYIIKMCPPSSLYEKNLVRTIVAKVRHIEANPQRWKNCVPAWYIEDLLRDFTNNVESWLKSHGD